MRDFGENGNLLVHSPVLRLCWRVFIRGVPENTGCTPANDSGESVFREGLFIEKSSLLRSLCGLLDLWFSRYEGMASDPAIRSGPGRLS